MSSHPPDWAVGLLRCPRCRNVFRASDSNGIFCEDGHQFPVRGNIIDLWEEPADDVSRQTARSFGYEWTTFADNQDEDAVFWSRHSQGLNFTGLGEVDALDAGCGRGRYTRFIARSVGRLIALDGSDAVYAAAENLAEYDNVAIVRADLRDAPFREGSFGFVSSIGVLHHLADPEAGFQRLASLVAHGGTMFLYLYSRPEGSGIRAWGIRAASMLRRVSIRVPHWALRRLSVPIAAVLWLSFVGPGAAGDRWHLGPLKGLPLQTYRRRPFRALWLDTFDRLSAPVEHRYVWSELEPWFDRAGLEVRSMRDDAGFYVVAVRPQTRAVIGQPVPSP